MNLVKDKILNKIIWTIISKHSLKETQNISFRALRPSNFRDDLKDTIVDIFRDLGSNGCFEFHEKDFAINNFDINKLLDLAKTNIVYDIGMDRFSESIKLWNTPRGISVNDICFSSFHTPYIKEVKQSLSDNGFIITQTSTTYSKDFIKDFIIDSPSEYTRKLWDLPYKKNEKPTSLYITFPDIYVPSNEDHA